MIDEFLSLLYTQIQLKGAKVPQQDLKVNKWNILSAAFELDFIWWRQKYERKIPIELSPILDVIQSMVMTGWYLVPGGSEQTNIIRQ